MLLAPFDRDCPGHRPGTATENPIMTRSSRVIVRDIAGIFAVILLLAGLNFIPAVRAVFDLLRPYGFFKVIGLLLGIYFAIRLFTWDKEK
jgi:hypothetical protein